MRPTEKTKNTAPTNGHKMPGDPNEFIGQIFALTQNKKEWPSSDRASQIIQDYLKSFYAYADGQMVYIVDYKKQDIIYSSGFQNNLGLTDPVNIKNLYNRIHPEDIFTVLKLAKAAVSYSIENGYVDPFRYVIAHDYRISTQEGDYKRFLRQSYIIHMSEGVLDLTVNVLTDISFIKTHGEVEWSLQGDDLTMYENLVSKELTKTPEKGKVLSLRETEVLQLLAQGNTSEQVAKKLHISPMTSVTHRRNIMKKLKAKNTNELIYMAVKDGVL